jgi:transmembrane sensor
MCASVRIEETAALWLARKDGGDWSEADQVALTQWLAESTAHRVAFIRLETAWKRARRLGDLMHTEY